MSQSITVLRWKAIRGFKPEEPAAKTKVRDAARTSLNAAHDDDGDFYIVLSFSIYT